MPAVGQFHHAVLQVTDLDRAERFYQDALGFQLAGRDLWPEDGPASFLKTDDDQYVVLVLSSEVAPEGPGVHTNFIYSTDDYKVVFPRLRELGCLTGDHRAAAGQRAVGEVSQYFDDPDGHHLQITAFYPEAFQVPASKHGKIVVGRIDDFAVPSVTHNPDGRFYLVRLQEGFLALNEVCTHMRCTVSYQPHHYRFYCACHDNKFTWKGEHIGHTPGTPPLYVYPIEFVNGEIVVDTDTTVARAPHAADDMLSPQSLMPRP